MIGNVLGCAARVLLHGQIAACENCPLISRSVMGYNYEMAAGATHEIVLKMPAGPSAAGNRRTVLEAARITHAAEGRAGI
jgi:hypothetical protein